MSDLSFVNNVVGVSGSVEFKTPHNHNAEQLSLEANWESKLTGVVKLGIPTNIVIQGSPDDSGVISGLATPVNGDGAVIPAQLAVGSTDTKVAFGAFPFRINVLSLL